MEQDARIPASAAPLAIARTVFAKSLGVTIEAEYTIGEYDIVILSARESQGLETWLRESGYRIPRGAAAVLGSYIKQGLRFFIAKVNLREKEKLGYSYLRPLQMAYESPRFMLPIRLGTVNADGPQDLFVFALTRTGRVETTNYRTVRLPTGVDVPGFVKEEFPRFYRDLFSHQVERESMRAVFLEYAWDMGWCDPCAADPLSPRELRELGVFWLDGGGPGPGFGIRRPDPPAANVFVTRLHVRYTAERFPEDLVFQETGDRENFQGRYVIYQTWQGDLGCEAGRRYVEDLRRRREEWARNLADLTGWSVADIRDRIGGDPLPADSDPWWKKIWGEGGR